ncbi:AAA family ATPase [Sulfitobacter sp. 1A13353]|uniref:AAA family ATPase n=1 Tax=Sulfitobacter sp. 1A13353 TaxID=3368568 RepID=UPI003746962F
MVQDLIIASRRMASLYRYKYIRPAHLLHAMTAVETGRDVISKCGFDTCILRAAMIREFKAYSATVRDTHGTPEPSDLFDRCSSAYLVHDEMEDYESGLHSIFKTIQAYENEDEIVKKALDESDMKREYSDPMPEEEEFLPDLDDLLDDAASDGELTPDRMYRKPEGDGASSGIAHGMRSAFRDPEKSTRSEPKQEGRAKQKLTKEMEESQAAVRAAQRDLSELARNGQLGAVVGRDKEIDHVIEVLMRRRKPNVILVAEPGVGKSALIEGLAARLVSDQCPDEDLAKRAVREVSLTSMVAGSRFRGDFESRMGMLISESEKDRAILFIDEIHMLMGSGAVSRGGMDGANILKPALARDGLSLIGATTPDEAMLLREDRALMRRFEIIYLDEPGRGQMAKILEGAAEAFLKEHKVRITPRVRERLLDFGERYLSHRRNPDRSFDLLDLAAVAARLDGSDRINEANLRHAVVRLGGDLQIAPADFSETVQTNLQTHLLLQVKGQDAAMCQLSEVIGDMRRNPGSRKVIRLTGPSSLGKTYAVDQIAAYYEKRAHHMRFENMYPDSFEMLWKRVAMTLDADGDAIIAIQGAGVDVAKKLTAALSSASSAIVIRSAMIFCIDSSASADGHSIGFRTLSEAMDPEDENVLFIPPSGDMRQELIQKVMFDIAQREKDSGIKVSARNRAHALDVLSSGEGGHTYIQLKNKALDAMKQAGA